MHHKLGIQNYTHAYMKKKEKARFFFVLFCFCTFMPGDVFYISNFPYFCLRLKTGYVEDR